MTLTCNKIELMETNWRQINVGNIQDFERSNNLLFASWLISLYTGHQININLEYLVPNRGELV